MKISLLQENLHLALTDVQRCISSRPQLPVLGCVLLVADEEKIQFFATDLQFGMMTTVPGKVEKKGKVAIPAKVFTDLISTLSPGSVELSLKDNTLEVKTTDATAKLQTFSAEDYPAFPTLEGEEIEFPLDVLAPAVQATSFAASLDETRPILTALCMQFGEELEIVGTDGFRLARITLPYSADSRQLLVPAKAVSEAIRIAARKKVEKVVFKVSDKLKQVFFSFEGYDISMRLLEGQFPPYQKIMPAEFLIQLVFDAEEFQQKLKTASIFAREGAGIIRFVVKEEGLALVSSSSTFGNQESLVRGKHLTEFKGEQEIAFNSRYVQEFLSVVKPDRVWFGMNESLKPAAFRPEGMDAFTYIIMPFRVNG
ncbi:DNA polymerase III subunit beta [Patescibacteria group bacterium]|nr:DNA polymerase III subunit beta [Patescibacteria group bacterium]